MIINEAMAHALWPNEDAIGKRIGFQGPNPSWREVVGVVGDVTFPSFGVSASVDTEFAVYQPIAQAGSGAVNIIVRTTRDSETIAADLRRVVSAIDADLPVYGLMTARASEQRQTASLRLIAGVLGGFAGLGLVLAAIGIFGVVSYSTAQRAREFAMRMALGARQSVVLWLVLKQGITLTMVGAVAGLAGGLGVGRLLSWLMPSLPSTERSVVLGAFVFMLAVALAAFFIPAWRISKANPMHVLRHD